MTFLFPLVRLGLLALLSLGEARLVAAEDWTAASSRLVDEELAGAGPYATVVRPVAHGKIRVLLSSGDLAVSREELLAWVDRATTAATLLYGQFPVTDLKLIIIADDGRKVHDGVEYEGEEIVIKVGRRTTAADLKRDWMLTHEMVHLGFPDVAQRYHWMEEGLATYFEPLVRARAGDLKPEEVWRDWAQSMSQGLPEPGDRGLDHTPTWGRTYWGGALFWLLADVEIRERSANRYSLDDAIRGIRAAGGNGGSRWRAAKVLEVGDRATGLSVLKDLHDRMGGQPVNVDLPALWRRLGVVSRNGRVTFDDDAPLAALRKSMTARSTDAPTRP